MREFLAAVIISLIVVIAGLSHALVKYYPYEPHIEARYQPDNGLQSHSNLIEAEKTQKSEQQGNESWLVFGYQLKITETFVALFTAFLFFATWALYKATRNLVLGADRTAERQLRAYIYVEKTDLSYVNGAWKHSYRIKNFGQTPAHKVKLTSRTQAVDWNGGSPSIPQPTNVENLGSMAPNGDFFDNENKIYGSATEAELRSGTKIVFLVGKITYLTVFNSTERFTDFQYYVGGSMGYTGGEMFADDKGNDAT